MNKVNLSRISQPRLKVIENFSVSTTHSWLFGVMVMTPDIEAIGCEFKYRTFRFGIERPRLISLILSTKLGTTFMPTPDAHAD